MKKNTLQTITDDTLGIVLSYIPYNYIVIGMVSKRFNRLYKHHVQAGNNNEEEGVQEEGVARRRIPNLNIVSAPHRNITTSIKLLNFYISEIKGEVFGEYEQQYLKFFLSQTVCNILNLSVTNSDAVVDPKRIHFFNTLFKEDNFTLYEFIPNILKFILGFKMQCFRICTLGIKTQNDLDQTCKACLKNETAGSFPIPLLVHAVRTFGFIMIGDFLFRWNDTLRLKNLHIKCLIPHIQQQHLILLLWKLQPQLDNQELASIFHHCAFHNKIQIVEFLMSQRIYGQRDSTLYFCIVMELIRMECMSLRMFKAVFPIKNRVFLSDDQVIEIVCLLLEHPRLEAIVSYMNLHLRKFDQQFIRENFFGAQERAIQRIIAGLFFSDNDDDEE